MRKLIIKRPHPHAALMALYAQDAAETAEPWLRWQWLATAELWNDCMEHPAWFEHEQYRRSIADACDLKARGPRGSEYWARVNAKRRGASHG